MPPVSARIVPHTHTHTHNNNNNNNNALETLATMTTLSIDSGDIDTVARYATTGLITDATTNPLFVSQAAAAATGNNNGDARYESMVTEAVLYAKLKCCGNGMPAAEAATAAAVLETMCNVAMDRLAVNLGRELSCLVPGRVSTEVDVRLSYNRDASVERARSILDMYREYGISKDRVLIKLAGTWEGIQAARILEEEEGVRCNITLIFSFLQAVAAAQAGVYLISPFPGRILDWHRKNNKNHDGTPHDEEDDTTTNNNHYPSSPDADPGVLAVKQMYMYYRKYGYTTICMPASWRPSRGPDAKGSDVDEILALAGIDEMTIPPVLLDSLSALDGGVVVRKCHATMEQASTCNIPKYDTLSEESYRSYWEKDVCGQEKLKEGIDAFTVETEKLCKILKDRF